MKQEKLQCGFVKVKKDKGMKRGLQVLLPISLLSFLLSYYYYSSCISCFIHSQKLAIKCFIQDNKFLFLFSNTVMLLLAAGDAGLLGSSPTSSGNDLYVEHVTDQVASQQQQLNLHELMEVEHDQEKNTHVCQPVTLVDVEEEGEGEEEVLIEEELELLNIDDLNRRFEEFIEREKKKWKLEALQLVMV